MSGFNSAQVIAPEISITYDESLKLYVGSLISRSGTYYLEGPDRASIEYQVEGILREEHKELVRNLEKEAKEEKRGRGLSLGGIGIPDITMEKEPDKPQKNIKPFSLLPFMFRSLWDVLSANKKMFSVVFGGIILTAGSKRALKKKLINERNRLIHKIMHNVREHRRQQERWEDDVKLHKDRIKKKRSLALRLSPARWTDQVKPDAREEYMNERVNTLRARIKDKKSQAQHLWSE